MQSVGYGVAMGNAYEEVKQVAKEVTDDNNHDGIAVVVNRLLQKEEKE
ncbi:MAG: HAD hydrolase family protein [Erysipelotrichaceae bacterium]|nr:HAD hydrolase family protein [Erysipelotrichaceae bacterium]